MTQSAAFAGATLRVDLDALVANYRLVQQQVGPAEVAAVVKADAYGLGAKEVAPALENAGCRHFFVALLSEAIPLRRLLNAGSDIYVLNGLQPGSEDYAAELGAIPVLNSLDQIERWSHLARQRSRELPALLQFDTGMARLGLSPEEMRVLLASPERIAGIDLRLVMSHLACADTPNAQANALQSQAFRAMADRFPGVRRSLDASGGGFLDHDHLDMVRAGIALYGGAWRAGRSPMHPVVTLEAPIVQVRELPAGAGVGYGLTSVADRPRRIATISVGYADGWPRRLGNCGHAYVGEHRVPIAGRISMDSITLDVTEAPAELTMAGSPVQLLGDRQTVDDVAADAGTIGYEILTQLSRRYARKYLQPRRR